MQTTNLVLGGHSFISQLGSDPAPNDHEAAEIVECCLDHGIKWFDTTYAPERVALGKALKTSGRRDEATIIAWNFFEHFGPNDPVSGEKAYESHHLQQILDELQTDFVDVLVVHPVRDREEHLRQEELALTWKQQGAVKKLGTWMPNLNSLNNIYNSVVAPFNVTTNHTELFRQYKELGWETLATSPFVRGWELESRTAKLNLSKSEVADLMLRYSAFAPDVDKLIVSIRKLEWIHANIASFHRGAVSETESKLLFTE
jgi:aryl-alcohol dehydrogenase-like predicted oxidoreductase